MKNLAFKMQMALIEGKHKVSEHFKKSLTDLRNDERGEVGVGAVLSIVLVLIVFAFIVVPQARTFVAGMFTDLLSWYRGLNLFPTT